MSDLPDRVELRPSRRQRMWWGILAVVLIGLPLLRAIGGPAVNGWDWLWLVLLCGCGVLMVAYVLGARLVLTRVGFYWWPNVRRPRLVEWKRTDEFRLESRGQYGTYIVFTLAPEPPPFGRGNPRRSAVPTWFGLKPLDQLRLMLQYRAAADRAL